MAGLSPKRRGRKEKAVNPLTKRVAELERDKRRLERRLRQAELLLEIQKKASQLLEIPLARPSAMSLARPMLSKVRQSTPCVRMRLPKIGQ